MAIRVQHEIGGIGGLAAYAGGQGKSRERQRKYALDIMRDERMIAQRNAAMVQQHQWDVSMENTRQVHDMDLFDARRQMELEDQAKKREWEVDEEENRREWAARQDKQQAEQQWVLEQDAQIEEDVRTGKSVLDPWAEKEIKQAEAKFGAMVGSRQYDQQAIDTARAQLEQFKRDVNRIGAKPAPQGADAVNRDLVTIDPKTGRASKPGPNEKGTHQVINGRPIPTDAYAQEQADKAAAEDRKRKEVEKRDAQMEKLEKEERKVRFTASEDVDSDLQKEHLGQLRQKMNEITVSRMLDDPVHVQKATNQFLQLSGRAPTKAELEEFIRRGVKTYGAGGEKQTPAAPAGTKPPTGQAPAGTAPTTPTGSTAGGTVRPPAAAAQAIREPKTNEEFTAMWAQAKPGEAVRGLDGKVYYKPGASK